MNPNDVAPMVVGALFIVVSGGVLVLRPLARRLGDLLEAMVAERRRPPVTIEPRIVETLERVEERLRLLEERQDFTDALIGRSRAQGLPRPHEPGPPAGG
jgi:hypothetical protein